MIPLHPWHAPAAGHAAGASGPIGSPLYDVLPGHEAAMVAVLLLPVLAWWLGIRARDGSVRAARLVTGYAALPPLDRLAIWAMAASAAIHLALAAGHGGIGMAVLFVIQATLLGVAILRATSGRSWRGLGGVILIGSIAAYVLALAGGDVPDQVGLATKLIEIVGLAAIARGATVGQRARRVATSVGVAVLVIATSVAGWAGATGAAAGGSVGHGHAARSDHHGGTYPPPGSVMPGGIAAEATEAQLAAAADLHAQVVAATARYADPAVAAADGYEVDGISGMDFHAANPAYEADDRILDPARPETLIYAGTPAGPVLLGVMFSMPGTDAGPMIGGPTTVWHAHEHVCIGLLPPGLSGLLSPLGGCPVGSVDVPVTNEMIHAWTVPGAPQAWGDLDDAWRSAYLTRIAGQ